MVGACDVSLDSDARRSASASQVDARSDTASPMHRSMLSGKARLHGVRNYGAHDTAFVTYMCHIRGRVPVLLLYGGLLCPP
jgi:hypothetical protein